MTRAYETPKSAMHPQAAGPGTCLTNWHAWALSRQLGRNAVEDTNLIRESFKQECPSNIRFALCESFITSPGASEDAEFVAAAGCHQPAQAPFAAQLAVTAAMVSVVAAVVAARAAGVVVVVAIVATVLETG